MLHGFHANLALFASEGQLLKVHRINAAHGSRLFQLLGRLSDMEPECSNSSASAGKRNRDTQWPREDLANDPGYMS
jgi:hypothetical protein